ncbi:HXXEE domain-containing protein [Tistrella mobilis]
MPAVYLFHIVEEYGAGFPAWMTLHMQADMNDVGFLRNNALFMTILVLLCLWATCSRTRLSALLLLAWGSGQLFWNFIFHLVTTVIADSYSPGLVTAALLYQPVSLAVAGLAIRDHRLNLPDTLLAFTIGAGLMLFVIWTGLWHFTLPVG